MTERMAFRGHRTIDSLHVAGAGEQNLWLTDLDRNPPRQLTSHAGFNQQPNVSPEWPLHRLRFHRTGRQHLWKNDIDGKHPLELTHGPTMVSLALLADGKWVGVYSTGPDGGRFFGVAIDGASRAPDGENLWSVHMVSPNGNDCLFYRSAGPHPTKISSHALWRQWRAFV